MSHLTKPEIAAKIAEYDGWLTNNPTHPDYHLVRNTKEAWEQKLKDVESTGTHE